MGDLGALLMVLLLAAVAFVVIDLWTRPPKF